MGSSIGVQLTVLLILALGLVHYRNEQLTSVKQHGIQANRSGRVTATLANSDYTLEAVRAVAAELPPQSIPRKGIRGDYLTLEGRAPASRERDALASPTPAPVSAVATTRKKALLNGPYYRFDDTADVDYKNVLGHQRMLCESRHQNFWLCQETDGIVTEENGPAEPAVFCRDCYGNTVPRLLARELGSDTWN